MKISNELKECFKYFNVYDISDKIKELSEKERYILAISSVDNHDEDNVICLHNFNSIRTEINNILSFLDNDEENDIIKELKKPGRDPRKRAKVLEFDHRIKSIEDLQTGMILTGIVTNVTAFGAFVNIGIKENGLIHKSNLSDGYVSDPSQFISLHEHVEVQVIEVDAPRKRVGLKRVNK